MANPKSTPGDIGWALLFMGIFLPCMVGCMLLAAIYVVPQALHASNCVPKHGIGLFFEFSIMMGGLFLGIVISVTLFAALTRRFLSFESFQRWVLQFENGKSKLPYLHRLLGGYLLKVLQPKGFEYAPNNSFKADA